MLNKDPQSVINITCIGAGPIGGGWTAHYLARGYRVTTYLHDESEIEALQSLLETAWASLEEIGLAEGASMSNFSWTTSLQEAVSGAEFIQESIPEVLELKQELYRKLGDLVDPNVVTKLGEMSSGRHRSSAPPAMAGRPTAPNTNHGKNFNLRGDGSMKRFLRQRISLTSRFVPPAQQGQGDGRKARRKVECPPFF